MTSHKCAGGATSRIVLTMGTCVNRKETIMSKEKLTVSLWLQDPATNEKVRIPSTRVTVFKKPLRGDVTQIEATRLTYPWGNPRFGMVDFNIEDTPGVANDYVVRCSIPSVRGEVELLNFGGPLSVDLNLDTSTPVLGTRVGVDVHVMSGGNYCPNATVTVRKDGAIIDSDSTPSSNPTVLPFELSAPNQYEFTVTWNGNTQVETHYIEDDCDIYFVY